MAAPPSPGVAISEQDRLVALISVLTRGPPSIEPPPPFSADRDSLGLSLEGCEPPPATADPARATACRPPRFQPSSWSCGIHLDNDGGELTLCPAPRDWNVQVIVSCPFQSAVDGLTACTAVRKSGTIEACPSVSACFQELFAGCVWKAIFSGTSILLTIL
jgi:hypothetical protein